MDRPTARELGVGCRFSLYPLCDDFGSAGLGALAGADRAGVEVVTDDVSTYASGSEDAVLRFVRDAIAHAAGSAAHVMASLLLSRGCPGEVTCSLDDGQALPRVPVPDLDAAGVHAAAHWSLYPLGTAAPMELIATAVEQARRDGTYDRSEHYATRLEGDLSEVLTTIAGGWLGAGARVPHVVSHATLSLGSPAR